MKILLLIETKCRELDGKIWLGYNLLKAGYEVVLSEASEAMNSMDIIKPDVVFYQSAGGGKTKIEILKKLKDVGVLNVVLDQEGGIFRKDEEYRDTRLGAEVLENIDIYFGWGVRSSQIVKD